MTINEDEPESQHFQGTALATPEDFPALATDLDNSFTETKRFRKDGWDPGRMAAFIGTLAETGVVTSACRAAGMSAQSAYGLRRRDRLFASAWEAALSMARERLADELLARSLKGSAEQLLRDGAIVAERHVFDNKLAFAILRRLDRRAELGTTFRTPPAADIPCPPPAIAGEWQKLVDAIAEQRTADAELLLAPPPRKVDSEVDNPPVEGVETPEGHDAAERSRVWHDWQSEEWRTDFPPPAGFDGDEKGDWEDPEGYSRSLTASEMVALIAAGLAEPEELPAEISFEEDEAERDRFFGSLLESRSAVATA